MMGQCHRYNEYEISPTKTTGLEASIFEIADVPVSPAAMISAVPTHGSKAAIPGKGVVAEKSAAEITIMDIPASVSALRRSAPLTSGNSLSERIVPSSSSHARVGAR